MVSCSQRSVRHFQLYFEREWSVTFFKQYWTKKTIWFEGNFSFSKLIFFWYRHHHDVATPLATFSEYVHLWAFDKSLTSGLIWIEALNLLTFIANIKHISRVKYSELPSLINLWKRDPYFMRKMQALNHVTVTYHCRDSEFQIHSLGLSLFSAGF